MDNELIQAHFRNHLFNPINLQTVNKHVPDHADVLSGVPLMPVVPKLLSETIESFCNTSQASQQLHPLDFSYSVEELDTTFMQ